MFGLWLCIWYTCWLSAGNLSSKSVGYSGLSCGFTINLLQLLFTAFSALKIALEYRNNNSFYIVICKLFILFAFHFHKTREMDLIILPSLLFFFGFFFQSISFCSLLWYKQGKINPKSFYEPDNCYLCFSITRKYAFYSATLEIKPAKIPETH